MNKLSFLGIFFIYSSFLLAQNHQVNIFPGITGNALVNDLVSDYKTSTVLEYNVARDILFGKIDLVDDSLECIYTGLKVYLAPGQDPTEGVYLGGMVNGINTEHSFPQGKGATGMAQSDMHHLYPSRIKTNSDRADHPYGEIPDNETKIWYYKSTERSSPPAVNRNLYSEYVNGHFEPRESVKGNIARSIFYFYTMYKNQADAADPNFFGIQMNDLCEWHYLDPVDDKEWKRNQKIAQYQGGKLNPFILDCSLVSRAYCNNIDQACESLVLTSVKEAQLNESLNVSLFPNPGNADLYIRMDIVRSGTYELYITDINGKKVADVFEGKLNEGVCTNHVDLLLTSGIYIITVRDMSNGNVIHLKYLRQ